MAGWSDYPGSMDYQDQDVWFEVEIQDGPGLPWRPATDVEGNTITADTREEAETLRYFYDIGHRERFGVPATTAVRRRCGQA